MENSDEMVEKSSGGTSPKSETKEPSSENVISLSPKVDEVEHQEQNEAPEDQLKSSEKEKNSSEPVEQNETSNDPDIVFSARKNKKRIILNDSDDSNLDDGPVRGDAIEPINPTLDNLDNASSDSLNFTDPKTRHRLKIIDSNSDSDEEPSKPEESSQKSPNLSVKKANLKSLCDSDSSDDENPKDSSPKPQKKSDFRGLCNSKSSDDEVKKANSPKPQTKSNFRVLCDSDSSDDEKKIDGFQSPKLKKSNFSNICDPESSDEGVQNSDEDISINIKKSRGKNKKSDIEKPHRMTGKEALEQRKEIISESERMTRESYVSLPYHRPKSHSLKEFMSKRKRVSDLLKTTHIPLTNLKLNAKQIEIAAQKLEEREKNLDEFYNSEESEDENEPQSCENVPEGDNNEEKKKHLKETQNQEVQNSRSPTEKTSENSNQIPTSDNLVNAMETKTYLSEIQNIFGENSSGKPDKVSQSLESQKIENASKNLFGNAEVETQDGAQNGDNHQYDKNVQNIDELMEISENDVSGVKNSEKSDLEINLGPEKDLGYVLPTGQNGAVSGTIVGNGDINKIEESAMEIDENFVKSDNLVSENSVADHENPETNPKSETSVINAENSETKPRSRLSILEKLKKYNPNLALKTDFKPKITKSSDVVILDNDLSEKSKAIDDLKKRFFTHNQMKNIHTNDEKEIKNIDTNILKHECAKVLIDHDDVDRVIEHKPGVKLKKLREELAVQMAKKRLESWEKQRQQVDELTKLDEEAEACAKKLGDYNDEEEFEEEPEMSESSSSESESELEENDIPISDKPRKKSDFVDSEVEVSDEENSQSDEDEDEQETDGLHLEKSEKKALRRIIVNDDDSNDFSDNENNDFEIKKSLKDIINDLSENSNDSQNFEKNLKSASSKPESENSANPESKSNSEKNCESDAKNIDCSPNLDFDSQNSVLKSVSYQNNPQSENSPNLFSANPESKSNSESDSKKIDFSENLDCDSQNDLHDTISLNSDDEIPLYQRENPNKTPVQTQTKSQFSFTPISCLTGMQSKTDILDSPQMFLTEPSPLKDKPAVKTNLFETAPSINLTQAFGELENLCSGTFTENFDLQMTQKKDSPKNYDFENSQDFKLVFDDEFITDKIENGDLKLGDSKNDNLTMSNSQSVIENSENFVEKTSKVEKRNGKLLILSSDEENVSSDMFDGKLSKKKKKKKRKLGFSDDEASSDDSDIEENQSDLEDNREVNYDSEENEVEIDENEEIVPKKVAQGFFENEAELSESEWGSEDENETGLDKFEIDEADFENYNERKLQKELGKIHIRQVLDQDNREVRLLQEMLLEDGELHGASREKKFKWKNADSLNWNEDRPQNEENDQDFVDDIESELEWRKQRHERESFLQEQRKKILQSQNEIEIIASDSQILQIGKTIIEKNSQDTYQKENEVSKPISKLDSFSFLHQKSYRGSFLARSEISLSRLSELTKNAKDIVLVGSNVKNNRNFLFTSIEKDDEPTENKKRKADSTQATPKLLKKMRVSDSPSTTPKSKKSLSKLMK